MQLGASEPSAREPSPHTSRPLGGPYPYVQRAPPRRWGTEPHDAAPNAPQAPQCQPHLGACLTWGP